MTVVPERFDVQSREETVQPAQIRDLALGVLRALPHTHVERIGINHMAHFASRSEDAWHRLGHELTPKDLWEDVLERPGMLSLSIQGQRTDDRQGSINVTVQPSMVVRPGIFINMNDEIVIQTDQPEPAARTAEIIEQRWDASQAESDRVMDAVMRRAES
jgi:hypothetical protein